MALSGIGTGRLRRGRGQIKEIKQIKGRLKAD
jgi:hypothetical protein